MQTYRHNHSKRRLTIERIESRLMLSGNGLQSLDTVTFNLDQFTTGYAIISNDEILVGGNKSTTNHVAVSTDDFDRPQPSFSPITPTVDASPNLPMINVSLDLGLNSVLAYDRLRNGVDIHQLLNFREQLTASGINSTMSYFSLRPGADVTRIFAFSDELVGFSTTLGEQIYGGGLLDLTSISPSGDSGKITVQVRDVPLLVDRSEDFRSRVDDAVPSVPVESLLPAGGTPVLVIAPGGPINTGHPIGHSDAQINVGRLIDKLLTSGSDFIDHTMSDELKSASGGESQLSGSVNTSQIGGPVEAPSANESAQVAIAGRNFDEGGMIPIQGIVSQLAGEATAVVSGPDAVAADIPTEISAELARVAVMELIEGEVDPAAPQSAADYTYLVAADGANFIPERISLVSLHRSQAALAAIRILAEQAGLTASLAVPANPMHFAALASAIGDSFANATMSAPLTMTTPRNNIDEDARSEAFSHWDAAVDVHSTSSNANYSTYGLVIGALALERAIAGRRQKQQSSAAAPPLPGR